MSKQDKQLTLVADSKGQPEERKRPFKERIDERESRELVIAFGGPIGSGVTDVADVTCAVLSSKFSYTVKRIKVSDLILRLKDNDPAQFKASPAGKGKLRYQHLQRLGNELREKYGESILAEVVIAKIATDRAALHPETPVREIEPERFAYVIEQLKHPAEVALLRAVYGNLFYLVGVLANEGHRKARLVEERIDERDAIDLMERDRKESADHGQQLEKTLELSDLFIRNNNSNKNDITEEVSLSPSLILGPRITWVPGANYLPRRPYAQEQVQ